MMFPPLETSEQWTASQYADDKHFAQSLYVTLSQPQKNLVVVQISLRVDPLSLSPLVGRVTP